MAYALWAKSMNNTPKDVNWVNRDRFILSGGHGSSLLYSLLHLFNYGVTIEDLKNFRQLDSKTPGHPEYGHTVGVEATTGPLGAGMGMAVGMAIAETIMNEKFGVSHYTYCMFGDGCLQEGVGLESLSIAGLYKLNKFIFSSKYTVLNFEFSNAPKPIASTV